MARVRKKLSEVLASSDSLRVKTLVAFWVAIILAIAHLVLGIVIGPDKVKDLPLGAAIYLALALVALLLPYIAKAKLPGGVEIELGVAMAVNSSTNTMRTLEAKLARVSRADIGSTIIEEALPEQEKPKLGPVRFEDDPQRGRFGGKSEVNGLMLSASFQELGSKNLVRVFIRVAPKDDRPLTKEVHFYLHDTFKPDEVVVSPFEGVASLDLLVYGGFTVGAWIPERDGTLLELDLAKVKGAPRIIREV